jgi:hypothetical protein
MSDDLEKQDVLGEYKAVLARCNELQALLEEKLCACNNQNVFPSPPPLTRFRLPETRDGITHRVDFRVDGEEFAMYIQPSFYEDGMMGEVFLKADKQGSFVSGLTDALSITLSVALQYGVPLAHIVEKLKGSRSGEGVCALGNPPIKRCKSVVDYLAQWLERAITLKNGHKE